MTDNASNINAKYEDIIKKFNDVNVDKLKDICRNNNITGYSTLTKPDLINLIIKSYNVLRTNLLRIKFIELLNICKTNKLLIDESKGLSKDMLIHVIISACDIKNNIIIHPFITEKETTFSIKELIEKNKSVILSDSSNNNSELEEAKQKLDKLRMEKNEKENLIKNQEQILEKKILEIKKKEDEAERKRIRKEEAEKKRLEIEESEKKRLEIEKEKAEKNRIEREEAERKRLEIEKEKVEDNAPPPYDEINSQPTATIPSRNRRPLPSCVRDSVWNHYIGEDINKHRCLCCKKVLITNRKFEVGHVISVKDGGTDEINNLRPICSPCNHSMGSKNMIEFVKTYGYYIG